MQRGKNESRRGWKAGKLATGDKEHRGRGYHPWRWEVVACHWTVRGVGAQPEKFGIDFEPVAGGLQRELYE